MPRKHKMTKGIGNLQQKPGYNAEKPLVVSLHIAHGCM